MKSIRNFALSALVVGSLSPSSVFADWDEVRIANDHPQMLDNSLVTGLAAGDTTREEREKDSTEKSNEPGSNAQNDRIWAELVIGQNKFGDGGDGDR